MHLKHILGFSGPCVAFAGIGIAIYINRAWWRLTTHAISDLGAIGTPYNYVLNVSLILGGLLTMGSVFYIYWDFTSKIAKIGISGFFVALIFLTMIGIFPEGTAPHFTVSNLFFYIGIISMLITGCGGLWENEMKKIHAMCIVLWIPVAAMLAIGLLAYFPGVAPAEFVGAITIIGTYFLVLWDKM